MLKGKPIRASAVVLANIDYSDVFEKAIEDKQVAMQNAIRAKNKTQEIEEEARQKVMTKADKNGLPLSAYVARLIKADAGDDDLTNDEKQWVEDHLNANIEQRRKTDEKTAEGFYRGRRKRGSPRKRVRAYVVSRKK